MVSCISIKRNRTSNTKCLSFSGKQALLDKIEKFARSQINITEKVPVFEGGTYALHWYSQDALLWFDFLYTGATIYLKRKRVIFDM